MEPAAAGVVLGWETPQALLGQALFEKGAVKFGRFEVKNQALSPSPVYIEMGTADNPNPGPLGPEEIGMIAREMFGVVQSAGVEYDFVCGVPHAGEPIAEAFRSLLAKGKQYRARLSKLGRGSSRRVSHFRICTKAKAKQEARRVLLLDDVISGADSKLEAISAVERAGYEVAAVVIAIDREQGGAKYLSKLGYKVLCWKALSELLSFYYLLGKISWQEKEKVLKYLERTGPIIVPQ